MKFRLLSLLVISILPVSAEVRVIKDSSGRIYAAVDVLRVESVDDINPNKLSKGIFYSYLTRRVITPQYNTLLQSYGTNQKFEVALRPDATRIIFKPIVLSSSPQKNTTGEGDILLGLGASGKVETKENPLSERQELILPIPIEDVIKCLFPQ